MAHAYSDFIIAKNNFFKNPYKVLKLFDRQEFKQHQTYPGLRTDNLLMSTDNETKNFALFLAQKVSTEVYPGIYGFIMDIRFHINTVYDNTEVNEGWIHSDSIDIAGVIYLTPNEQSLETGTSLFEKKTKEQFKTDDFVSRQEFNLTGISTDEYLKDLRQNHNTFTETLKVGNMFNRLISYDGEIYHRPNKYNLDCGEPRKSVVFFIKDIKQEHCTKVNLNYTWEDE